MVAFSNDQLRALASLYGQGRFQELTVKAEALIQQYPDKASLYNLLGAAKLALGHPEQAKSNFSKAVAIEPGNAELHNNLGAAQERLEKLDAAVSSYRNAVLAKPDYAEAYNNLGNALMASGNTLDAIKNFNSALKINPDYVEASNNLGVAYKSIGKLEEAIASYKRAIEIDSRFADAHNNLGNAFRQGKNINEAIDCYKLALQINSKHAQAHCNLGTAYADIGKPGEAIPCYKVAIQLKPDFVDAYTGLGNALYDQSELEAAIINFRKALELKPGLAAAQYNLGEALKRSGRLDEAITCYCRALELKPDYASAQMRKLQQLARICDWNAMEYETGKLIDPRDTEEAVSPFTMLAIEDDPEGHRLRADCYAARHFNNPSPSVFTRSRPRSGPIRIGYFSADFNDHPVGRLMARVFELHDRSKFVVHGFSNSPPADGELAQRFKNGFDHFHEVYSLTDEQITQLARYEEIDIAIDLSGYTKGSRSEVFARRAAPIQVNYLGYPGTMAAPFMNYIIADKTIIPEQSQKYYSEKIIYLPHCYQAQDNTMQISEKASTRPELGLPVNGFVFCCFNNSYKIGKAEFDIWMRLLANVDGSVLWLYRANKWAEENLLKEAAERGIDRQRLVFTPGTFHPDYLARLKLADLYLDTFNYNAGATASDALWVGLPVLTKRGKSYTARMASSLLEAVELPELVTTTEQAYENLALALATNPEKLQSLRTELATKRETTPLFDTQAFTADLEKAYQKIMDRYSTGAGPEHVFV